MSENRMVVDAQLKEILSQSAWLGFAEFLRIDMFAEANLVDVWLLFIFIDFPVIQLPSNFYATGAAGAYTLHCITWIYSWLLRFSFTGFIGASSGGSGEFHEVFYPVCLQFLWFPWFLIQVSCYSCLSSNYQRLPNTLDKACLKLQLQRSGLNAVLEWKENAFDCAISYIDLVKKLVSYM